jgi:hypothetical protein
MSLLPFLKILALAKERGRPERLYGTIRVLLQALRCALYWEWQVFSNLVVAKIPFIMVRGILRAFYEEQTLCLSIFARPPSQPHVKSIGGHIGTNATSSCKLLQTTY